MAVPKRRKSSSKGAMRRANHDKVTPANVTPCPNCSAPMISHRVCSSCGFYKGRSVLNKAADEQAK